MLNKVILMGRLTKEPELRHTQSNISVTSFSLAVDRGYARQGEEKQTDFFDIVAWRQTAEFVSRYFKKGQLVAVTGRLQTRKWQDNQGANRIAYEIVADEVFFAESKRDQGYDSSSYQQAPAYGAAGQSLPPEAPKPSKPAVASVYDSFPGDDDLPF